MASRTLSGISSLDEWPNNQPPLFASPEAGAVQSEDAERILTDLIASHRLDTKRGEQFSAGFRSAPVGPITVIFQRYRAFSSIRLTEPIPMIALTIPLAGDLDVAVDGQDIRIPQGSPLVFNPGAEPRMFGPANADFLTVTVPRDIVDRHLEVHFPRVADGEQIVFGTRGNRESAGALAHAMWQIQQAIDTRTSDLEGRQSALADQLVSALLLSHPNSHTRALYASGAAATEAAVWEAVAVLRANPQERIRVADIAGDMGISVRSLELGFARVLGVTPSEFQRDLRLEMAHRLIGHGTEGLTIAQVSETIGYVNQGRFARDYARRFGTGPAADLRSRSADTP